MAAAARLRTTASIRTIFTTRRRGQPTARRMPISCVRSSTDMIIVSSMLITPITMAITVDEAAAGANVEIVEPEVRDGPPDAHGVIAVRAGRFLNLNQVHESNVDTVRIHAFQLQNTVHKFLVEIAGELVRLAALDHN